MIKANELRIGNWTQTIPDKIPFQIRDGEDIDDISDKEGEFDCYEPIVLSPEILEKAGFVGPKMEINERLYIYDWEGDRGITLCTPDETGNEDFDILQIKYLHQLQNLFYALTGEELNIQL